MQNHHPLHIKRNLKSSACVSAFTVSLLALLGRKRLPLTATFSPSYTGLGFLWFSMQAPQMEF